jgi:hypothetical protein
MNPIIACMFLKRREWKGIRNEKEGNIKEQRESRSSKY